MKKSGALTTIIISTLLAYIPCFILYVKSASFYDIPKMFHVPEYLALIVSIFFVLALTAYAFKLYTLAVVIGIVPLIAEIVAAVMLAILLYFRKDLVNTFVQEKIKGFVAAPLALAKEAASMPVEAVTKPLGALFGK